MVETLKVRVGFKLKNANVTIKITKKGNISQCCCLGDNDGIFTADPYFHCLGGHNLKVGELNGRYKVTYLSGSVHHWGQHKEKFWNWVNEEGILDFKFNNGDSLPGFSSDNSLSESEAEARFTGSVSYHNFSGEVYIYFDDTGCQDNTGFIKYKIEKVD